MLGWLSKKRYNYAIAVITMITIDFFYETCLKRQNYILNFMNYSKTFVEVKTTFN